MAKYRSGYEKEIKQNSNDNVKYEKNSYKYIVERTYNPDFTLPNGIEIEAKGNFRTVSDRTKLLKVKEQNPHIDLRILFQNPRLKINKGSKTTYAMWAEKNGFIWAEGNKIPEAWVNEKKK